MAQKGPQIIAKWTGTELTYAAPIDLRDLRAFPAGTLFTLKPYKGPTEKQMRFLRGLAARAAENSPTPTSGERVIHETKLRYGWFGDNTVVEEGRVIVEVRSLADLDREELSRFIEQLIQYIIEDVCPGMDPAALRREVENDTTPYRGGRR